MVNRYKLQFQEGCFPSLDDDETGSLVFYDDYAILQAENERLKKGVIGLIASGCCDKHSEIIRSISFPKFQKMDDFCKYCTGEQLAEAQAIIDKLPRTKDGVVFQCGEPPEDWDDSPYHYMKVYFINRGVVEENSMTVETEIYQGGGGRGDEVYLWECYSTREAAEKARQDNE